MYILQATSISQILIHARSAVVKSFRFQNRYCQKSHFGLLDLFEDLKSGVVHDQLYNFHNLSVGVRENLEPQNFIRVCSPFAKAL